MQVVWFKRDLRVEDHAPLARTAKIGRCLCLYVYETELIGSETFDAAHLGWIDDSLAELARSARGSPCARDACPKS